jgi:hypothetical protein
VRVVQAPLDVQPLESSLARAEAQLATNSTIPKFVDTNVVAQVINFSAVGTDAGAFSGDQAVPGLDPDTNGTHDYAVEIEAYLDLAAGVHRFGVITDDGFSVRSGATLNDKTSTPLAFRSGGTANQTFDFLVTQAGLYPFRMVWYERGGDSNAELFSVDPATGEKTLINDPAAPNAIKAYTALTAPALVVESAPDAAGPFTVDSTAVVDQARGIITVPMSGAHARFFRLRGAAANGQPKFGQINIQGSTFTVTYSALQ